MKDYSLFFKKPSGFITNYKIEGNEILVYTSKTKKGEPHRFPATEKWRKHFEERLEKQYIEIINNQGKIIEYNRKRKSILYKALFGIILALYAISLIVMGPSLAGTVIAIVSFASTCGIVKLINKSRENKFKLELKEYEKFITNRQAIEEKLNIDKNITSYLSQATLSRIEENQKKKASGEKNTVLDIEFMDKTPIKDLSKMRTRYEISKSLEEKQIFCIPNENETQENIQPRHKRRTLKP